MEIDLGRLLDALPGLVWTARPDGAAEYIGRRWLEFTGMDHRDAVGLGWRRAIHPEDAPRLLSRWAEIIASGRAGEVEARLRRHDGVWRWFLFQASPLPEASGAVLRWCGVNTEIEDRVRAEAALRDEERRFEFIVEGLPAMVTLMTPQGELESGNQYMLDYFGRTLEELKARPVGFSFHPEDRPQVMSRWRRSVETGEPYDHEARLRRGDGVYRWFHTRGFPLRDAEGRIQVWYLLQEDIDQRRRAEAWLAGEKQLLEQVALGLPLSTVLDDLSDLVERLAPGCYCSILLVDEGGDRFKVGAGPSLPPRYNAILDGKAIDPRYGPCSLAVVEKVPVITDDLARDPRWEGSVWPGLMAEYGLASCWSMPILSGARDVLGIFAIYRHEPEGPTAEEQELIDRFTKIAGIAIGRARADAALKAGEAELRQAYRHLTEAQRLSQTGSFRWDLTADTHDWSDETYRIWEVDPGTAITTQMLLDAIHPDDLSATEAVVSRAAQGEDFEQVFRIVTAGGAMKHVHAVGHLTEPAAGRPVFFGAIQDVTERKTAEEALNRASAELAHVARVTALGALTASIAHEVNQPLAGIITNASTCLRMLAADPPNLDGARATAQRTIRDGNRASEVIQRLRALFARRAPAMEPMDLNAAAREVLALSSGDLQRRRVIVRVDFADDLPPIRGDRVQLQQVILNLILNAADAMATVEDRPRDLWISTARAEPDLVALSVRDVGAGIAPEAVGRLFDAFYTTKADGMGIGLSISRSIVQAHEGRIWAAPNDGPGMTFSFAVPSGLEPAEAAPGPPNSVPREA
ncbi:MAG: PAS domain-containing protein [Proteobacteria bacterium]|nr:PAS domain-containing protein [Pseudomonadota bacterium]